MSRSIPTVEVTPRGQGERAELTDLPEQAPAIRLDTPAWAQWLAAETSASFAYPLFDRAAGWITDCHLVSIVSFNRIISSYVL